MIRLDGLTLGYGGAPIVDALTAELPDTGVIAVFGASGSGKSTLLRALAGRVRPVSGTVSGLENRRISVVFQNNRLLPWLTLRENIELVGSAEGLLELAELTEEADRLPSELSGGQQRRGALCRALAFGGDVLLLDEPFAGIDDELKARLIERLRGRFPLTVIATHDREEAFALSAEAAVIEL